MRKLVFFNIFILCAIMSQAICALSKENEQPANVLVRNKRIIDLTEYPRNITSISQINYIVNIVKNRDHVCGGSILSHNVILTAAYCVDEQAAYKVLSGSHLRNYGIIHNATHKFVFPEYNATNLEHNLALLLILPPIDLVRSENRHIELHNGMRELRFYTGILSGWGCTAHIRGSPPDFPENLRSISVPIIKLKKCREAYHGYDTVSDNEICTFDRKGQKGSCFGDTGGPLVVHGHLLGVLSWTKVIPNRVCPDVYVNLAIPSYKNWILGFLNRH